VLVHALCEDALLTGNLREDHNSDLSPQAVRDKQTEAVGSIR
jgi:hypothetical protein